VAAGIVLVAFAAVFMALSVNAFTQTSASWDEPMHLTAGYAALVKHDFRLDPSHPPLLRIWTALPTVLFDTVSMQPIPADGVPATQWLPDAYGFAHRFLYVENDADRLLYRARFMTVILGVVLGIFVFLWTREWLGFVPAVIALACYTFEPNLFAHASLVTTDLGVTCFIFGAVYFAWLTCRKFSFPRVAGLAVCFSLALVSKFSAVLLGPVVLVLLGMAARRHAPITPWRVSGVAAAIGLTALAVIWASYGLRYLPAPSAASLNFAEATAAHSTLDSAIGWIDSHRLLPNAYTQGFLYALTSVERLPAFLAGSYSADGWWYYFPLAFLLKTPLPLIALIAIGLVIVCLRRRGIPFHDAAFVLLPIIVFLTAAMWTGINIGLRHILPVYPFLILVAAVGARELLRVARRPRVVMLAAVAVVWTSEYAAAYPHALTFFNHAAGGPEAGYRYLADSNLGWGQGLKPLKKWMHDAGVTHVNLAYFGQADPAYYDIDCTHLPGAPSFATEKIARPTLPGYVAISSTILTGVYSPPPWRLFYAAFRDLQPAAVIGNSIRVYWVDRWPEPDAQAASTATEADRSLADALLFDFRWSDHAILHYRRYLDAHAENADVLVSYALALMGANQVKESVAALERAIGLDPRNGAARLVLGQLLLANGRLPRAAIEAERAVSLQPQKIDAHLLLGRVYAAQGRLAESAREFARAIEIEPDHAEARDFARRVSDAQRLHARSAAAGVR
jgi:hypothetical protein